MKDKKTMTFLTIVSSLTIILLLAGFIFQQAADDKINGFLGIYDSTADGRIAYVYYEKGIPYLYVKEETKDTLLYTGEKAASITDIAFTENSKEVYFTLHDRDVDEKLETSIQSVTVDEQQVETIFKSDAFISEITIDPNDSASLYYLQADTITNYSPVAKKRPHDVDAYRYHLEKEEHDQLTHLQAYDMNALTVDSEEDLLYVIMNSPDDLTAEEIFDDVFTTWEISFQDSQHLEAIPPKTWEYDISDMTLLPNKQGMIFSGVNNYQQNDTFEYELFYYEWGADDYIRLTEFGGNASRPTIHDEETVYFTVDENFAGKKPDYHLYKQNLADGAYTEIDLSPPLP